MKQLKMQKKNVKNNILKKYIHFGIIILFTQTILSCRDKKESIDKVESSKYEEYCSYCGNGMIKGQSAIAYSNKFFCNENCQIRYQVERE
jgi:hypothetical protein